MTTEERILQISNDIAEDRCTASREELIEVARYWRAKSPLKMPPGDLKVVNVRAPARITIIHNGVREEIEMPGPIWPRWNFSAVYRSLKNMSKKEAPPSA